MNGQVPFILIHGAYGTPDENWLPWLARELESRGGKALRPVFPTPEKQNLETWLTAFAKQAPALTAETVLVGHSLGCAFILNLLERSEIKIRAAFLVAGFVGELGLPDLDRINQTFVARSFDWECICSRCASFHVIDSDNDPYVPVKQGAALAKILKAKRTLIPNGGHFNAKAGYVQFPKLLDLINLELQ